LTSPLAAAGFFSDAVFINISTHPEVYETNFNFSCITFLLLYFLTEIRSEDKNNYQDD